jgi:glycosyltransferase involved in cell wall biosynthesis
MTEMTATVVIATKNRKDDLRRAVASCLRQTAGPEILVIDDGSTDGTEALVRRQFPTIRYVREDISRGVVVRRNQAAGLARGDIVFSIDDDAEFPSQRTVAQTLTEFNAPSIGAVAIPFVNVNYGSAILQRAPKPDGTFVIDAFIGTAYAVRRDVFLRVGGYRESIFHQGEEEDFSIRMLDAGYVIRTGNADPIHHYESPIRDRWRMDVYGARNKILFSWHNVPMPYLLPHMMGATVNRLLFGVRQRHPWRAGYGLLKGFAVCLTQARQRRPVRRATYRAFRELRRAGQLPLSAVQHAVPVPPGGA